MKQKPLRTPSIILTGFATVLAVSSAAGRTDPGGGTGGGPIIGSLQVRVIQGDTGLPAAGAFVMVGPRAGTPFEGNWGFTSETGAIVFSDPELQGPIAVTAGAAGYSYLTIVAVDANDLVLPLSPLSPLPSDNQVGDYVSGIDVNNGSFNLGDGYIDMAFVLPCLRLQSFFSLDFQSMMGPPETIEILGQPVEVPSNVFIPLQYELLVPIVKDHYYLYLAQGQYTLSAMSGRVPRDVLINASDITEIIPATDWREIDILDVTVSGDTNAADLFVDPDLNDTVTLNLSNIPDNTAAWCFSVGDLDNLAGLGRLVTLGINSYSCPLGGGPCGATVGLTTTPATGDFAGMSYFPTVMIDFTATDDALVLLKRGAHPQSYTEEMSSFFQPLELVYDSGHFVWSDAANPPTGSPPVHVQIARIASTAGSETYWEFIVPGSLLNMEAPVLPPEAPPGPQDGIIYKWTHAAAGLGFDLPAFDFNSFAFSDIYAHCSHLATDQAEITYVRDPASVHGWELAAEPFFLLGRPNPFGDGTTVSFELPQDGWTDLSVYRVDGGRVAQLHHGWLTAGPHHTRWTGTDARGRQLPSGVYIARLSAGNESRACRLILRR